MYRRVLYFLYLAFFWICPQEVTSGQVSVLRYSVVLGSIYTVLLIVC